jgi:predicted phosphodiesterase
MPRVSAHWIAVVGDLHGAVPALRALLRRFEKATRARVELILQVGDLELEAGVGNLPEIVAIEGNHDAPRTRDGVTALGRAGVVERLGLRIAGLSGTYHPGLSEQADPGDTRACTRDDVSRLLGAGHVDVLLLHDWPRGLLQDADRARLRPPVRDVAAFGNPHGQLLVERLAPAWVFCGHHHVPYRRDLPLEAGTAHVRCLADVPKGGIDAIAFLKCEGGTLVESAPLDELEAFARP